MTKSLVTGGCGFIGSHLVDRLVKLGHEVLVLDRVQHHKPNPKATYYLQDLSENYPILAESKESGSILDQLNIFFNPRNIYEIMKRCFFAVISPGTLFYELSYFKKPTYLIYLNKKQKNLALSWSKGNLITGFQSFKSNDFNKIIENMHLFKNKKKKFIAKKLNYGDNSKKIILKINKIYRSLNE